MFIAIVKINIRAMKLDEITVTFHPNKPNKPIIIITEKAATNRNYNPNDISKNYPKSKNNKYKNSKTKNQYRF